MQITAKTLIKIGFWRVKITFQRVKFENLQTKKTTSSNSVKVAQFRGKTTHLATLTVGHNIALFV